MKRMELKNALPLRPLWAFCQAALIMNWMANLAGTAELAGTDSLFSIYALVGVAGAFCVYDNYLHRRLLPQGGWLGSCALSILFSLATWGSNYPLFTTIRDTAIMSYSTSLLLNLINTVFSLAGGWVVCFAILTCLTHRLPLAEGGAPGEKPRQVFGLTFGFLVLVYGAYLLLDEYPGHVTPDSLDQIEQGAAGIYSNNHPYWHTRLVRVLMLAGYKLLGTPNGAVAFYSLCQLVLMAFTFALVTVTLYQAGVPKWVCLLSPGAYGLIPYHIAYSITMWKDVPFALGIVLTAVGLVRLVYDLGGRKGNYLILALGAVLMGLMRNAGLAALAGLAGFCLPGLIRRSRGAWCVLAGAAVLCAVLTGPVLTALNVQESDPVEGMSLPLQQMARVVAQGEDLTEEEAQLLGRIFDLERIPEIYTPWLSDPVKIHIHEGDLDYLRENQDAYQDLWLNLGKRYPGVYLAAWVEQTKGYWNGGYDYHQYAEMVEENPFGMHKTGGTFLAPLAGLYFGLWRNAVIVQPLQSIGLQVWILGLCLFLNLRSKRRLWMICLPPLLIVLGLLLGTPVFAEFRYSYSVFALMPLALGLTLFPPREE